MPFKPNSQQGAVYPKCLDCDSNAAAVYIADPDKLADKNTEALRDLPKNATQQQAEDAMVLGLLCAACASAKKVKLIGELPWPPPAA